MVGIVVDIGTGDGSFAYKLARNNPDKLIIGLDPNHTNMAKVSLRSLRKKGKTPNVLYVLASIEELPTELNGQVNQVFINFPWAALLQKIVSVDEKVWNNLKRICQNQAIIDILFGYDQEREKAQIKDYSLPILNSDFLNNNMLPKLSKLGFELIESKTITPKELNNYPSSWAKKLAQNSQRRFYYLRLKRL